MVKFINTPLRRLEGIAYWIIEDPDGIYDLINTEIRREWEEDARSECREPKKDPWLMTLSQRRWSLKIVDIDQIKLNPKIMNYVDRERGYVFQKSLDQRRRELQTLVQNCGVVIWPLIVKGEGMLLVDGYCRYATLKTMNARRTYVYVGTF